MYKIRKTFTAIILFSAAAILMVACNKEDDRIEEEQIKLREYLEQMGYSETEPTSSGLYYVVLQESEGPSPVRSDFVTINFTGRLIDGTVFDTSDREYAIANGVERDDKLYGPYKFLMENMTIAGMREGMTMMNEGEISRIIIPSNLAFGSSSVGIIPPFSTLIYDVELLEVINDPVEHEQTLLEAFLEENEVEVEPETSGLYYIEEEEGVGNLPQNNEVVTLHYKASLIDGRVFDQSESGNPLDINLVHSANYIPGFIEGIKKMRKDGKARLIIPSEIGYGSLGSYEGIVPPYSTLIFDVEIVNIN